MSHNAVLNAQQNQFVVKMMSLSIISDKQFCYTLLKYLLYLKKTKKPTRYDI